MDLSTKFHGQKHTLYTVLDSVDNFNDHPNSRRIRQTKNVNTNYQQTEMT